MTKSVLFVYLDDPANTSLNDKLIEAFPDSHYKHSDQLYFIESSKSTRQVREILEINSDRSGMVIKMASTLAISGFTYQALWSWLSETEGVQGG